jgi:hypothetical protein
VIIHIPDEPAAPPDAPPPVPAATEAPLPPEPPVSLPDWVVHPPATSEVTRQHARKLRAIRDIGNA